MAAENESFVASFYEGKTVLLTGATGFVGKVILEKLLWEVPNIGSIFVLIRPRSGQSPEARLR